MRNKLMKRLTALVPMACLAMMPAQADEGMWTLFDLPDPVYEQMAAYGFQLPCDQLYNDSNALSNVVVNFSGYCSGVVVSPDGLVFTNHHCGFSAINAHSTVEHDYMLNGFYAKSYAEELPNENMFVSFMKNQRDVTDYVNHFTKGQSYDRLGVILDSLTTAMTDSVKRIDSTLHVNIDAFYEGNRYFATTYQDFTDLRLVFCVPKSMGKYGGETDNWMWPRQTCDFSVFRIYADPKTNGPAAYSKDNVPYHPKHWAPVSLQGYRDGDFAMTVGYPGSTERYLSSYGISDMRNIENPVRIAARDIKLAIMKKYMDSNEKLRIQYEDKYANSANYWKNSKGMDKCIDSIGIIRQKADYEKRIQQWLDTAQVKGANTNVDFARLASLYDKRRTAYRALNNWVESFSRVSELMSRAMRLMNGGMEVKGPKNKPKKQYCEFNDNSSEWDINVDKELTAAMLKYYGEKVSKAYQPEFYNTIRKKFGGDYKKYTEWLYDHTKLLEPGARFYPNNVKKYYKDPGVKMGEDLMVSVALITTELRPYADSIAMEEQKLCQAKIEMEQDLPHYSDANFTMRLSYGQVGGYMIGEQKTNYYTSAESIVEKMKKGDKIADYKAEPIMHELLSQKSYGRYQDKTTGKLQLCFLTNNDITGGNSGSPMFDGKGQLIGLAFDGNWDSLSSDINFDKRLARCIGVDIRYVLYMMDKWGHADRLLKEINPVE